METITTIEQAIVAMDKFVEVYERDYDEWDATYWSKGVEDVGDILKSVPSDQYIYSGEREVHEDPAGEVYVNVVSYIKDGKPAQWLWVRNNY